MVLLIASVLGISLGCAGVLYADDAGSGRTTATEPATPERRALQFLMREVPQWPTENHCYSCHNNGDAARALYRAARLSYPFDRKVLQSTSEWLMHPDRWKHNGGEGEFSDKKLAHMQFSAALAAATEAGDIKQRAPLRRAAERLAETQEKDGSWQVDAEGVIGSAATWGRSLATAINRETLIRAGRKHFAESIARADAWLRQTRPKTVLDAAAVLMALADSDDEAVRRQRKRCLQLIRQGQAEDGGWGPYLTSPTEPFDTSVVLLALSRLEHNSWMRKAVRQGRAFLIRIQLPDGSWPETTRPAQGESYAQRLSTTGWATLALLATRPAASE